MKVPKNVVATAEWLASESTCRFQVGAVVHDGKKILGIGCNDSLKTHPKSPHPYKFKDAEFSALMDAVRSGRDVWGLSIYVHRIKKDGTPGLAKPCAFCAKMLALVGIEDVNYSEG